MTPKLRLQLRIERDSLDRLPQRAAKQKVPQVVIRFANESLVHRQPFIRKTQRFRVQRLVNRGWGMTFR